MTRQMTMPTVPPKNPANRPPMPIAGGQGYTFKDIIGILRRRLLLIAVLTFVVIIIGMSMWFYLKRNSPKFTATNFITCEMPREESVFVRTGNVYERPDVIALITAEHAARLNYEGYLSELLMGNSELQATAWFNNLEPAQRIRQMQKDFRASPVRNSKTVQVSMTAGSASDAKKVLDIILEQYRIRVENEAVGDLRNRRTDMSRQRDTLVGEIAAIDNQMVTLKAGAGIGVGATGMTTTAQEMMRYNAGILEQTEILTDLQKQLSELDFEIEQGQAPLRAIIAAESDPAIYNLQNQITNYNQQLHSLIERFGDEHREVKMLRSMTNLAEEQIQFQRQNIIQRYAEQQLQTLNRQILSTQDVLREITRMYNEAEIRQQRIERDNVRFVALTQEKQQKNNQLSAMEERIRDFDIQIQRNTSNVRFHGKAMEPNSISFPLMKIFLAGSVVLGLMLSVGLAFLLEMVDDAVRSPVDISRYLNAPSLGMIPLYDQDDAGSVCVEKIAMTHPSALISEFYRQVRTNLDFSSPADEMNTILITSTSKGDGKTCTAVNMAITYATEGKKILLIDANFRRPKIQQLFEEASGQGLSRLLVGQASVAEVIKTSDIRNLDIINSGPLPPNPADLLSSKAMKQLLDTQKEKYDLIIIDGPPALVVVDARIMAGIVDGTMVVVDAGKTSRGMAQRMLREINQSGGKTLGVLLNGVKPRKGGYFEKAYKSYYEYASDDKA